MKKLILILSIMFLCVGGVFAQDYSKEWAIFLHTISKNVVMEIEGTAKYEILVYGNKNLKNELCILSRNGETFGRSEKELRVIEEKGTNVPNIIFIDKSVSVKKISMIKKLYPFSLIVTNHHDYNVFYGDLEKFIGVFSSGAHIRSLGNPLISFELSRDNFQKSRIISTTDLQSLFNE